MVGGADVEDAFTGEEGEEEGRCEEEGEVDAGWVSQWV